MEGTCARGKAFCVRERKTTRREIKSSYYESMRIYFDEYVTLLKFFPTILMSATSFQSNFNSTIVFIVFTLLEPEELISLACCYVEN